MTSERSQFCLGLVWKHSVQNLRAPGQDEEQQPIPQGQPLATALETRQKHLLLQAFSLVHLQLSSSLEKEQRRGLSLA